MAKFIPPIMNILPHEFLESCNQGEIEDVLEWLQNSGFIKKYRIFSKERLSYSHEEYLKSIYKLENLYHTLPNEDSNLIVNLAKKY